MKEGVSFILLFEVIAPRMRDWNTPPPVLCIFLGLIEIEDSVTLCNWESSRGFSA